MFSKNQFLKTKNASKIHFQPLENFFYIYMKQNYKHFFVCIAITLEAIHFPTFKSFFCNLFVSSNLIIK